MKINSIAFADADGGHQMTLGVFVEANEELEMCDAARIFDILQECEERMVGGVSRDTAKCGESIIKGAKEAAAYARGEAEAVVTEPGQKPKRKRRTKDEMAAARAAEAAAEDAAHGVTEGKTEFTHKNFGEEREEANDKEHPDTAVEAPVRRRRPTSADATSSDGSADSGSDGRRRRRSAGSDAVGGESDPPRRRRNRAPDPADDGASGDSEAPSSGRRGRRSRASAGHESTEPPSEPIKDTDLLRAASDAADTITPKGVQDIMAEFEVSTVSDIPQEDRRKFLAELDNAVDAEQGD